jgi:hypothetical protein
VDFVMKGMVSVLGNNWKRPILALHVEPLIIQLEIGTYSGVILAYRSGLAGVMQDWLVGQVSENSTRWRQMTKYQPYEQNVSASIKAT